MRSELSNALSNVIKPLKFIEKDLVEVYLHFWMILVKIIQNLIFFFDFKISHENEGMTSTRSFSISFKVLITFESALESSDSILFCHKMFGK